MGLHLTLFLMWIAINTFHIGSISHFDPSSFALLDTGVALKTILLASIILMRQSGLARRADEREHLMLQILLLTEKEVSAVVRMSQQIAGKVGLQEVGRDIEIKELGEKTSVDEVAQTIQEKLSND